MHLVIADMLLDELKISNPALFYCGNLAPDAVMNRDNYVRDMKTHTHFKDGKKPHEFRIKENQEAYMERLMEFSKQFLKKDDPQYELYLGYIVHILVDELYLLDYFEEFLVLLETMEIPFTDRHFGMRFTSDVDQVDRRLARAYRFHYPMPETLQQEKNYEIPGWITSEELEASKKFIIDKHFGGSLEYRSLEFTTYKRNYEFIDYAVAQIPGILRERFPWIYE